MKRWLVWFVWLVKMLFYTCGASRLSSSCRSLLSCSTSRSCIKVSWLQDHYRNKPITSKMYDALTEGIDYGCIFNTGCNEECNACSLCKTSKLQLTDVLSGSGRSSQDDCSELVNCATECVKAAGAEVQKMYNCLLHGCAYHCFNGSCPKCSSFTTRIFNQKPFYNIQSKELWHKLLTIYRSC